MISLANGLAELQLARARLAADQGRIARRNARRAMVQALQHLRQGLDNEYPSIQKPRGPTTVRRKVPLPPKGWVQVTGRAEQMQMIAEARAPLKVIYTPAVTTLPREMLLPKVWVPQWVKACLNEDYALAKLKACRKSRKLREQIIAANLLRGVTR